MLSWHVGRVKITGERQVDADLPEGALPHRSARVRVLEHA